jgi:hypothetical protein
MVCRLCPHGGGRWLAWLSSPLAAGPLHPHLNSLPKVPLIEVSATLPQQREDRRVHQNTQGNASQDLRRGVVTHLDPGPGDHGHQGPDG